MALDIRYIPITMLNAYFVDKDSATALADGTLEFYRDTARSTPKAVYELVSTGGTYTYVALPNPVELSAAGTAMNAGGDNVLVYAYPFIDNPDTGGLDEDLYYVVAKNSDGDEQWTREAIPFQALSTSPVGGEGTLTNELSNPQFSRYFLTDDVVSISVSGATTYPIAPDWDLVASGTGTITIERVPVSGNEAIPTYPPYYLTIVIGAGITAPYLRQRLYRNSGIWSDQFVSGFIAGKVGVGSNAVTMKYKDASGVTSDVTIFDAALTSSWATYGGSVEIGDSSDTLSGEDAYVDIVVELPLSNTIDITSIQVLVAPTDIGEGSLVYDQRSANREQALMGDYFIPRLEYKNVPSLAKCWDFTMNPRQLGASGTVVGATAQYIWDQTICQSVAALTVTYNESTRTNGLVLNHNAADKAFALIQYLDEEEAAKFVGTRLSVNINGYTTDGGNSAEETEVQVKIFANAASNQFGTLPTSLVTVADDGTVALTGTATGNGWYEITRSNLPVAKGALKVLDPASSIDEGYDIGFNGWAVGTNAQVTAGIRGIAIVVSFVPGASSTDYNTNVDSIGVTPGDIPTRPAPMSLVQTLFDAQRYYSKSFILGTVPAQNAGQTAAELFTQARGAGASGVISNSIKFPSLMRATPTITLYNPDAANAQVRNVSIGADCSLSTDVYTSTRAFVASFTTNGGSSEGQQLAVHWSADSRIGI